MATLGDILNNALNNKDGFKVGEIYIYDGDDSRGQIIEDHKGRLLWVADQDGGFILHPVDAFKYLRKVDHLAEWVDSLDKDLLYILQEASTNMKKVTCIKYVRNISGFGLIEAKLIVEQYIPNRIKRENNGYA